MMNQFQSLIEENTLEVSSLDLSFLPHFLKVLKKLPPSMDKDVVADVSEKTPAVGFFWRCNDLAK